MFNDSTIDAYSLISKLVKTVGLVNTKFSLPIEIIRHVDDSFEFFLYMPRGVLILSNNNYLHERALQ